MFPCAGSSSLHWSLHRHITTRTETSAGKIPRQSDLTLFLIYILTRIYTGLLLSFNLINGTLFVLY